MHIVKIQDPEYHQHPKNRDYETCRVYVLPVELKMLEQERLPPFRRHHEIGYAYEHDYYAEGKPHDGAVHIEKYRNEEEKPQKPDIQPVYLVFLSFGCHD